ncbi:efflux RND transporter periplasmic adaptor subunit [Chitinophaga sp.]|uniref:efflux RND transporter periplasmic adaptor subunit n=1 Tax=Chitinophaga sp. TaxID=1869181 RepID=UPI0031DB17F2
MKKLFFGIILILSACMQRKEEHAVEAAPETAENVAFITLEQMKAVGIELDTVSRKSLVDAIKSNGMLTVPNQNKALVTALTSGIVKSLTVLPGDYVKQGEVIATLVNPELTKIQQELQMTVAQLNLAKIEQQRQQELVAGNAAPLKNLQRVETELATLTATRNALQQQLATLGISPIAVAGGKISTTIPITAPISGTISNVTAEIGANVDAATPVAQIVNNSELHLDLFVYEKDLPKLKPQQAITFTLTNNPGKTYEAAIFSIGTAFENDTKTIPVHAVVNGDKAGLIEGMNVTAVVSTGAVKGPAVPAAAIVNHAGQDYVFVLMKATKDGYEFEKWPVAKGVTDVGYSAITAVKELPAGARVVSKGAFFVLAKLTNKGEE